MCFIFVGNELMFVFGTASDYVQDNRRTAYGFRCIITGYEYFAYDKQVGKNFIGIIIIAIIIIIFITNVIWPSSSL